MSKFLFIGGDKRIIHAAAKLNKRFDCYLYGFDKLRKTQDAPRFNPAEAGEDLRESLSYSSDLENGKAGNCPLLNAGCLSNSDMKWENIVLPLPCSNDNENVNSPYSAAQIPLSVIPGIAADNASVFCGKSAPALKKICAQNNLTLTDYFEREELAVMNAVPTAEGALEIIMRESSRSIYNLDVLVTGYGRIAKVLAKYLTALGANVTVAARKTSDLSWARIAGCLAVNIKDADKVLHSFNAIINTIPAPVFTREHLLKLEKDCIIVDLASSSCIAGNTDKNITAAEGIKVIWALGLPGKAAPITSGEIIAETIFNIISEKTK